ncbi:flagellar motor protein [Oxalobacteraceae bacterium R-40]|uniref:Flagellar motor protein n=1 Tax=Keguizhuia sedimenti TaxID=3064264 RepID=A0ABU1BPS0_9BURK|nr:flagellar motor protein [Oxalobacteraceae bacterium R-40]
MDWGSLSGLIIALAAILIGQKMEGGHLASLIQPAAFVIVMLGTIGAVLLQSGGRNFWRGLKLARHAFVAPEDNHQETVRNISMWAAVARREGLLGLDRHIESVQDPFLRKGLQLVVDGSDSSKVREILESEVTAYEMQQRQAVRVWEAAGGYAPTIGILGAVLGLIHVMENLADPSRLGSGIAVAFVATIYGVGLANLVFLPIGNKLKANLNRQVMQRDILVEAFAAIASGDNPRVLSERMAVYQSTEIA